MKSFLNPGKVPLNGELQTFVQERREKRGYRYCSNLINQYNIHPRKIHRIFYVDAIARDNDAEQLLAAAMQHWDAKAVRSAFTALNRAIGTACSNKLRQTLIVQRSRIYYQLKAYEQCVQSFRFAHSLRDAYMEQEEMILDCYRKMSEWASNRRALNTQIREDEDHEISVQLRWMPRANESTIHSALQLKYQTSSMGVRLPQVISTQAFRVGEVIAVDRALSTVLLPEAHAQRCNWCYKENYFALRPCKTFDCPAMYCSSSCMQMALFCNHESECSLTQFMKELDVTRPVIRLVMTTFRDSHDVMEWGAFRQFSDWDEHTIFEYRKLRVIPRNYRAKLLYAMSRRTRVRTNEELFYFNRLTAYVYKAIKYETYLLYTLFQTDLERHHLRDFIFAQLLSQADFAQELRMSSTVRLDGERQDQRPYARAVMPLCAFIQHSCTPNVAAFTCAMQQTCVCVVRPIQKGDCLSLDKTHGLYDGTGNRHKSVQRELRRGDCACPRRPADMPFPNEASAERMRDRTDWDAARWCADSDLMQHLFQLPVYKVHKMFDDISSFLHDHNDLYPCRELYEVRRCFDLCAERMFGPSILHDLASDAYADKRKQLTATVMERDLQRQCGEQCSEPSDDSNASAVKQMPDYALSSYRNGPAQLLTVYGEELGLAQTMLARSMMPPVGSVATLRSFSSSILDQLLSRDCTVTEVMTSDEEQCDEPPDEHNLEHNYAAVSPR